MLEGLADSLKQRHSHSQLAETVLLDARNEDFDAHASPFFSTQQAHQAMEDSSSSLERNMQLQMEEASVVSSVDSRNYEFRQGTAGGSVSGVLSASSTVEAAYRKHLQKAADGLDQ